MPTLPVYVVREHHVLYWVDMMSTESQTPPHHPTYKVSISHAQIAAIVGRVYSGGKLIQSQQLSRGKSFNNRIYFLEVEYDKHDERSSRLKLVLKLCGHYFGATKVQNEVGALLLLERFCPTVPSSKLVAWSENGRNISQYSYGYVKDLTRASDPPGDHVSDHGWVLQTQLPGRILTFDDLDGVDGHRIIQQLAGYMAEWRMCILHTGLIGNLCFSEHESGSSKPGPNDLLGIIGLSLGGLILTQKYEPEPLHSWAEYYTYQLRDQYEHLLKSQELATLRWRIQEQVADLLRRLPTLPFFSSKEVRFSHMDFSPRNILVCEDESGALTVTGILDFEFSAFLPSPSEFLNSLVNQSDDWPLQHYRNIMKELHEIESKRRDSDAYSQTIDMPAMDPPTEPCLDPARCLCSYHVLRHLGVLESVIRSTAPWWISATSHIGKEQEVEQECEKAASIVVAGIEKLSAFWKPDDEKARFQS